MKDSDMLNSDLMMILICIMAVPMKMGTDIIILNFQRMLGKRLSMNGNKNSIMVIIDINK